MEFVDIAGIVKGASEGAGLGNKFLSNIRTTDAIVQVVRCFDDSKIIHGYFSFSSSSSSSSFFFNLFNDLVDGNVNPERDIEVINMELILSDMSQIEKRLLKCLKDPKTFEEEISILNKVSSFFSSQSSFLFLLKILFLLFRFKDN